MSLLSLQFILLSFATAIFLWSVRGPFRILGFLAPSGYFAFSYLETSGMVSTVLFCCAGYLSALLVRKYPHLLWAVILGLTLTFIYARKYSFLFLVLPESLLTDLLRTAGLSFLFFKILHVVIDTASGTFKRLPFLTYLSYCLNFTTFLLGPIQRYQDFESQWEGRKEVLPAKFEAHLDAVNRILRGMVKKFVVAEYVGLWALQPYTPVETLSIIELLLATYVFYFFLYFDFSGYCDIVIGVGCLLGVRPPENFYLPFLAPNISQFWLRVHKSLTLWLTDYVFNPLYAQMLRSKSLGVHPLASAAVAVMITMIISGFWHGVTFNFLLFGLVHGIYLVVFRLFDYLMTKWLGRRGLKELRANSLWKVAATAVTFNATAVAYIFFVLDISQLSRILERI